jgi:HEAT repeat protein
MAALVTGNQATTSVIERGLNDADGEVRRFAAVAAGTDAKIDERERVLKIALADKEPRVRLEALRGWGRHLQKTSCAPIVAALNDPSPHVMLQAIDQLGAPLSATTPRPALIAIVTSLTPRPRD